MKKGLTLTLALCVLLFLPLQATQKLRGYFFISLSPVFKTYAYFKSSLASFFSIEPKIRVLEDEIKKKELEIALLQKTLQFYKNHTVPDISEEWTKAVVIYRQNETWTEGLWINKGSLDSPLIKKNSPVLYGNVVVGVIDLVQDKESRVRLITDPNLNPSVRVLRTHQGKNLYLAKGELGGAVHKGYSLLKGTGFNYDFPDNEGPALDLRSKIPIVQKGDLLVTTGLDGVFPKGLKVARVATVFPLKEGDYYFDIEAESLAGSLNDLSLLFIISPLRSE